MIRLRGFPVRYAAPAVLACALAVSGAADESLAVFKLGQRFFSDSLYNLALEQYQKYLGMRGRDPENDPAAYYHVAQCHDGMENMRKAAEAYEEYVKLFPSESNVMDAMYAAGRARREVGDYKEASDWFYAVWSRFVGSALARTALFEAAACAEKDKNPERAIELYGMFLAKFERHDNARQASLALASLHIAQKEYSQAEGILEDIPRQWQSDRVYSARVTYYRALLHQKMQKHAQAAKFYRAMMQSGVEGFPEERRAYEDYVDFLVAAEKYGEALPVYAKLFAVLKKEGARPGHDRIYEWAESARRSHNYDVAEKAYRRLLLEYPDTISANLVNYRIAECQVGTDDFPQAIETLRRIESSGTADEYAARAVAKIGDLYFSRELYPSAIAAYRRYLELSDRDDKDRILYRIGKIYQEKYERYGAALREFENLLKWYPASSYYSRAVLAIAECYERTDELRSAIRQYEFLIESSADEKLVAEAKKRATYLTTFRIRNAEAAAYKFAELMRKKPEDISELERLQVAAAIYEKDLKDFTKALETYQRIRELEAAPADSVRAHILHGQARVYQRLHEKAAYENDTQTASHAKEQALLLYREILEKHPGASSADDAAFRVLELTNPNIAQYEQFLETFPQSAYLPEVLFTIAKHYEKRSRDAGERFSEKAVASYRQIIEKFPSSEHASPALMGLARNYLVLGELDSVESTLAMHLERYPGSPLEPEAYFTKGLVAKRRGDFEAAADIFKQVLYRYPFSPFAASARFELAFAELETGQVFEALNNFRLYEQGRPEGPRALAARYGIGTCLLKIGKEDEATAILNALLSEKLSESLAADVHYALGQLAEKDGETFDALNHYKQALQSKSFTRQGDVLAHMGKMYFESRVYADAADAFERALPHASSKADSIDIATRHITSLIMNGKVKKADRLAKDLTREFGKLPASMAEIVYYEGVHYLVEKEYDRAIKRFEYILAKYDATGRADDAAYQIPLAHFYAGQKEDALKLFHEFPTRYPQSEYVPLSYFKVAMLYHGQNEFAQAAEFFTKAVDHEKSDAKTRFRSAYNAAVAYQKISSWLDAARMYTLVQKDFPGEIPESSLHLKIGFCLIQASRIEEALKHFEKANVNPAAEDKPEILYWIATCYAKLGEYQRAITEYLKVPYLYSGVGKWGVTAEFESARLYERQGEYEKAITLYKKVLQSDGEQGRFGRQSKERIQRLTSMMAEKP
ncbi:MAG: tetratricopeptide repeat protein [Chitinivibrionales bacterium]|nr:tetratricopeptide repeat protein [Chitinivibrionales bacterium]MBD3395047.1 tetratricopeptide repeat protein [Chitinivibrionales bacterium]